VIPCTVQAPLYTAVWGTVRNTPGTGSHCTNSLAVYPSTRESGCIHNCVLRTPIIPLFGCDLHVNPVYPPMPSLIPSDTAYTTIQGHTPQIPLYYVIYRFRRSFLWCIGMYSHLPYHSYPGTSYLDPDLDRYGGSKTTLLSTANLHAILV